LLRPQNAQTLNARLNVSLAEAKQKNYTQNCPVTIAEERQGTNCI